MIEGQEPVITDNKRWDETYSDTMNGSALSSEFCLIKLKFWVCLYVCMYVCMYVHFYLENGYTDLNQTWHAYSFRPGREHRKVTAQENVSCVRVPVKISSARK
jgi:hypothetical protein